MFENSSSSISSRCIGFIVSAIGVIPFLVIYINNQESSFASVSQVGIVFSVLIGLIVLGVRRKNHSICPVGPVVFYLFVCFIWLLVAACTSFWSEMPFLVLKRTLLAILPALLLGFVLLFHDVDGKEFLDGFGPLLIFFTAVAALWALLGLVGLFWFPGKSILPGFHFAELSIGQNVGYRTIGLHDGELYWRRPAGLFPNPNGLGMMCAISLVLLPSAIVNISVRKYLLVLLSAGLIVSLSRTAFVLLFVAIGYLLIPAGRLRHGFVVAIVVFSLLLPFVSSMEYFSTYEVKQILPFEGDFLQLRERGDTWLTAINALPEFSLFGAGFGQGGDILFGSEAQRAVHSVFLNALVETGLAGCCLLLLLWLSPIWRLRRESGDGVFNRFSCAEVVLPSLLLGMFAASVFDLSITRFHYLNLIFFAFVVVALKLQRATKSSSHA